MTAQHFFALASMAVAVGAVLFLGWLEHTGRTGL